MSSAKDNLLLLFERPHEPVFTAKGDGSKYLGVPKEFLDEQDQELSKRYFIKDRAGSGPYEVIRVEPVDVIPKLPLARSLNKRERFSVFVPLHREMAAEVIDYLMGATSVKEMISFAANCRAALNPELFNYALSVAMIHNEHTQDTELFSLSELFPDKFFSDDVTFRARKEVTVAADPEEGVSVELIRDYSATDLDVEHRLAYFREDLGVNLHHWHWHLVYPFMGPDDIVKKDRRGELFYYMHQQIVARYNMERFCNQLPRVKRLLDFKAPVAEAYYSKLSSEHASRNWPGRGSDMVIKEVSRPRESIFFDIEDLERWRDRIYDAIHRGYIITPAGRKLELTAKEGIDVLGNLVEASALSKNPKYYGDLHNMMHVAVACIHDPDYRHLEPFGVMGDVATAMRDPVFYRVHAMVDDIFQKYKATLTPYTADNELLFSGVSVVDASIQVEYGEPNTLVTFWKKSAVNLSRGLDFAPFGPVYVEFTHLQHRAFSYHIEVTSDTDDVIRGTVRIFMAPKLDERGQPMDFNEQRKFFVELDRFVVELENGTNTIERRSEESSVTIPFEQTYRDLDKPGKTGGKYDYCGCGWPHNLLIPRGTEAGFMVQLFVMVSDYNDDKVEEGSCCPRSTNYSYCGVRSNKYPDARAMGFPFDRNAPSDVKTLDQFLVQNMMAFDVKIEHHPQTSGSDD